jgi:DNA-binding NarL/FixJ family response regulator
LTTPTETAAVRLWTPRRQFSERERDVLILIAEGLSDPEIADHYVLSLKTVRTTYAMF